MGTPSTPATTGTATGAVVEVKVPRLRSRTAELGFLYHADMESFVEAYNEQRPWINAPKPVDVDNLLYPLLEEEPTKYPVNPETGKVIVGSLKPDRGWVKRQQQNLERQNAFKLREELRNAKELVCRK